MVCCIIESLSCIKRHQIANREINSLFSKGKHSFDFNQLESITLTAAGRQRLSSQESAAHSAENLRDLRDLRDVRDVRDLRDNFLSS